MRIMKKNAYKMKLTAREAECTTLRKLYDMATTAFPTRLMCEFVDGTQSYTYSSFRETCNRVSTRMSRYGISAGDKVAILSQNMPNWSIAFFAATAFGRVSIPILPDSSESEVTNILTHSETKAIFVSQRLLEKISPEVRERLTLIIDIETFEFIKKDEDDFRCDGWTKDPSPDDLACIIYTSGTTGNAKGVMLSHRNLCHNVVASMKAQPSKKSDRFLAILPLAHTYQMSISFLYPVFVGASTYYLPKPPTPSILLGAMKKVRPTTVLSVPLVIEKVYKSSVLPTINKSRILSWMKKSMPWLLYWLIGRRLVKSFGGKVRFFGIGGAKLDPTVEAFLLKCRFPYAIGYGLTECAPLVSNAMVHKTRLGSIGVPAYKVEVKILNPDPATGEGEIICRGDNVMIGYYKDPARTKQAIDDDGWFHTNDVATIDKDNYLYIKGRLNNTIIGATGENIYPEEIEMVINDIDGVNESLVIEREGKLVALVKFDDNVLDWNQATEDKFFETLEAQKKAVLDFVNKHVGKNSKVAEVDAMKDNFEKTATQKIRRFKYKNSYGDEPERKNEEKKD